MILRSLMSVCALGTLLMAQSSTETKTSGLASLKAKVRLEAIQALSAGKACLLVRLVTPLGSLPLVVEAREAQGQADAQSVFYVGENALLRRTRHLQEGGEFIFQDEHPLLGFGTCTKVSRVGIREVICSVPGHGDSRDLLGDEIPYAAMASLQGGALPALEAPSLKVAMREGLFSGLGPSLQVHPAGASAEEGWLPTGSERAPGTHGRGKGGATPGKVDGVMDAKGQVSLVGQVRLPWPGALYFRVGQAGDWAMVLVDEATGLRYFLKDGACKAFRKAQAGLAPLQEVACSFKGQQAIEALFPQLTGQVSVIPWPR